MIEKVSIAEVKTKIDTDNRKFLSALSPFAYDFRSEPDISAKVVDIELKAFLSKYIGVKTEEAKLRLLAESYFGKLTEFGGFGIKCNLLRTDKNNVYLVVAKDEQTLKQYIDAMCYNSHSIKDNGCMIAAVKKEKDSFYIYTTPWTNKTPVNEKILLRNLVVITSKKDREYVNSMQRLLEVMLTSIVLPQKGETLGTIIELIEMCAERAVVDFVDENDYEKGRRIVK